MVHLDQRAARCDLRVVDQLADAVDRADRDAVGEEELLPFLVRPREERVLERRDEAVAIARAVGVGAIARIVGQLRTPDDGAEHLPELLAAHGQRQVARARAEGLVGQERLVGGAHRLGEPAVGQVTADHGAEQRELSLEHRDVDGLAVARSLAGAKREEDAERRVHARRHVRDGHPAAHAVPARLAGHTDHPALRLEDQVERRPVAVRAVLAEPGDRAVDDPLIARPRRLVAEAEPGEGADAIVLQHHVGPLDEAEEELPAPRVLEVDLDALLVPVQAHEVRGLAAGQRRAPGAGDVAVAHGLQLDDAGAEVRQHGRTERAGQGMAQIEHRDVLERQPHQRPPATAIVWPVM